MSSIKAYLSKIGQRGGKKSRRQLSAQQARDMVRVREAQKAYRRYHTQCFWSFDPELKIRLKDVPWVCEQLKKNGSLQLWSLGDKLCR